MGEIQQNHEIQKFSNQELLEEFVRRMSERTISKDELILALIKIT